MTVQAPTCFGAVTGVLAGGLPVCATAPVEADSASAKKALRMAPATIPRFELRRDWVGVSTYMAMPSF